MKQTLVSNRASRAGAQEQIAMWTLTEFVEHFESQTSPELLVNIMVDALVELERHHRRGLLHGALEPDCIRVTEKGQVSLIGWTRSAPADRHFEAPEIARGQRPTPATDIYSIAAIFKAFMPDGARVHPDLKKILYQGTTERFRGAWTFRSVLLDYLADMGMEGGVFFVSRFLADPVGYNRSLIAVLSDRECRYIRYLNKHGRRRKATAELNFLLEIAPVNRQALSLWRAVRQGRQRVFGHLSYAALVVAIVIVCAGVIADKLGLPLAVRSLSTTDRPKALVIEPLDEAALKSERRPSSSGVVIELEQTVASITAPAPYKGKGAVRLDLDQDAQAYFDGAPGAAAPRRDGEMLWLSSGEHTVTVVKEGLPPAMARVTVQPDKVIELSGRALVH